MPLPPHNQDTNKNHCSDTKNQQNAPNDNLSQQQRGQIINPFSLQSWHSVDIPASSTILWLPLHLKQGTNLTPAHPSQGPLDYQLGFLRRVA